MREFILLALKAKTTGNFDLFNLKEEGRLDLVCRAISSALFVSNGIRRDTIIHVVLNGPLYPPKIISFNGENLQDLNPDEISISKMISLALRKGRNLKINEEVEISFGVKVCKKSFEHFIKEKSSLYYLDEKGDDIRNIKFNENSVFILGDNRGLPKNVEKLLKRLNSKKVNLGPITLFASHCIVLVQNELDRQKFV